MAVMEFQCATPSKVWRTEPLRRWNHQLWIWLCFFGRLWGWSGLLRQVYLFGTFWTLSCQNTTELLPPRKGTSPKKVMFKQKYSKPHILSRFWVVAVPKNNYPNLSKTFVQEVLVLGSPGMASEARASQGHLQLAAGTWWFDWHHEGHVWELQAWTCRPQSTFKMNRGFFKWGSPKI